jgi:hypothetical protein
LFASSGIEFEIVARAIPVEMPDIGQIPIARAEERLSMKVLSMTGDVFRIESMGNASHPAIQSSI